MEETFLAITNVRYSYANLVTARSRKCQNSARHFAAGGRYWEKAKFAKVTSSSAASRSHTFERTHPPDTMAEESETFAFQAEINQLLSLIINVSAPISYRRAFSGTDADGDLGARSPRKKPSSCHLRKRPTPAHPLTSLSPIAPR